MEELPSAYRKSSEAFAEGKMAKPKFKGVGNVLVSHLTLSCLHAASDENMDEDGPAVSLMAEKVLEDQLLYASKPDILKHLVKLYFYN